MYRAFRSFPMSMTQFGMVPLTGSLASHALFQHWPSSLHVPTHCLSAKSALFWQLEANHLSPIKHGTMPTHYTSQVWLLPRVGMGFKFTTCTLSLPMGVVLLMRHVQSWHSFGTSPVTSPHHRQGAMWAKFQHHFLKQRSNLLSHFRNIWSSNQYQS